MRRGTLQRARLTWQRFARAIVHLAGSEYAPKALRFVILLFICMFGITGLNVFNSYVGRDFMSAIEHQNLGEFWHNALLYLAVFGGSTAVAVFYRFAEERLGLVWREQLTGRLANLYLSERTYYRLDGAAGIANPDQRIAEDVRAFTTTTLSFTLLILNGSLAAVSFSGVLWSISPRLFGVAVGYALCGSLLTIWLGKPLIGLNYRQLDMEASFRAALIHVRENSESIALAHREGRFKVRLTQRLDNLTANFRRIVKVNRNLGFFTTGYNYLIQIIPALIVAPLFIKGEIKDFGVVTQSAMAFSALLGALSLIVTQFQSISAFSAVTARLNGLGEAMEQARNTQPSAIALEEARERVEFDGVTLFSSDGKRRLIGELSLVVARGQCWLVTCLEDEPKVALLRAMAGIWENGSGRIVRPGLDDILFLAERPYLPPGMLRDILVRMDNAGTTADAAIHEVLDKLDLTEVVRRLGGLQAHEDWDDLLAIGEQHLFSVARILLAKPAFVVLDRPGSALPKEQIRRILDLLLEQGMGVVVLAKNGESDLRFDACLELSCDGRWSVTSQPTAEQAD
ncbi:MAG: ABC transporter ATP-binding protein/permease [Verrucomicrobia bacterium]|nr:MAG: ABC transporter ATP-binding protein/permease [Verrucomicrobiota bacterium]